MPVDLSNIPFETIRAELERRYPVVVMAIAAQYPNQPPGKLSVCVATHSRRGLESECLGLAATAVLAIEKKMVDGFGTPVLSVQEPDAL